MNRYKLLLIFPILLVACTGRPVTNTTGDTNLTITKKSKTNHPKNVAAPPVGIAGVYRAVAADGQSEACDISVRIQNSGNSYTYEFTIYGEKLTGKASVARDSSRDTYITFDGIQWAEYRGDLSDDPDTSQTASVAAPIGVEGLLGDKEITIQNAGNSMNYYVKFAQCSEKYIHLVKQ